MKRIALIALAVMLVCSCAFAETAVIGSTGLTVEIPDDFETYTLIEDEIVEGLRAHFAKEASDIDMYVLEEANDDWTIEELAGALENEEGTEDTGLTTINGIVAAYRVFDDGTMTCVEYDIIEDGWIESIMFTVGNDEAKQISMDIMNTLKK